MAGLTSVLATAARVPAALVWAIIFLLRWCETRFIHPVASWFVDDLTLAWEEGAKSLVREGFAALTRGANGATAWLLSLLVDRRYWRTLRAEGARSRRGVAWEAYWREARPSTLNAVVARAVGGGSDGSEPVTRGAGAAEGGAGVGRGGEGTRRRRRTDARARTLTRPHPPHTHPTQTPHTHPPHRLQPVAAASAAARRHLC